MNLRPYQHIKISDRKNPALRIPVNVIRENDDYVAVIATSCMLANIFVLEHTQVLCERMDDIEILYELSFRRIIQVDDTHTSPPDIRGRQFEIIRWEVMTHPIPSHGRVFGVATTGERIPVQYCFSTSIPYYKNIPEIETVFDRPDLISDVKSIRKWIDDPYAPI